VEKIIAGYYSASRVEEKPIEREDWGCSCWCGLVARVSRELLVKKKIIEGRIEVQRSSLLLR
jgi:hypothetical protein